jgi:NTP pyrophosphatase (non-canonical NTP hydrolase)
MAEQHFNGLTPAQAELLALLAEECGELVQAIGKTLRHGLDSVNPLVPPGTDRSNRGWLEKEMGDVRAAMILLCEASITDKAAVHSLADVKRASVQQWLHHARVTSPTPASHE